MSSPLVTLTARVRTPPASAASPRVLLLNMPWGSVDEPSLALAILKAELSRAGVACIVKNLQIHLLRQMKVESYKAVADLWGLNDFTFSRVLEGAEIQPDQMAAFRRFLGNWQGGVDLIGQPVFGDDRYAEFALRMRNEIIPRYLDDCMAEVEGVDPTLVGFTCLFDQSIASVALAKRIKARYPNALMVLGGYSVERPVGVNLLRAFDHLDAVAFGEGEAKIVKLAHASVQRELLGSIPNIIYRDINGAVHETVRTEARIDLDTSPMPDYDDWFRDIAEFEAKHQVRIKTPILPVESSRGCWWGQKSHCVFCGIDEEALKYRQKSPERVIAMLGSLRDAYGIDSFRFSDYILPRSYYTTLLPMLAELGKPFALHWEMKANVREREVEIMKAAGVWAVQPGIESFSSATLRKMDKGITGIQNLLTIKLLMERGIFPLYNILYGFPFDEPEDVAELCRIIPYVYHLYPPTYLNPVLTTRYAPMQADPARFGYAAPLAAEPVYEMIFSREFRDRTGFELTDYCYVFERPYSFTPELQYWYGILVYQVTHWRSVQYDLEARLSYERDASGQIHFFDSRSSQGRALSFGAEHGRIYELVSRQVLGRSQLAEAVASAISAARLDEIIDELASERLVLVEGTRLLGLALPIAYYDQQVRAVQPEPQRTEAGVAA